MLSFAHGSLILIAIMITSTAALANVRLVEGGGYPLCVNLVRAINHLPGSTELSAWPDALPPIPGVEHPSWTALDPKENIALIRAFFTERQQRHEILFRSKEEVWNEIGPPIIQKVNSGAIKIESTIIRDVKLGPPSHELWTTDIRFIRISEGVTSAGTIAKPLGPGLIAKHELHSAGPLVDFWGYMAASLSSFPNVRDALVYGGMAGLSLILVKGQPWFVVGWSSLGIPYTSDLELSAESSDHDIWVDQRCLISFPIK